MENLLSIGEVARARNINVQSLRYYEKLGVLIPAYINPETGYRYYSLEQLMILDTIILCVDLGISLKELKNYVNEDGQLEFERLLRAGKKIATDKIKRIESNLSSIDRNLQQINSQKAFMGRKGHYSRFIFKRYVITMPCEFEMKAQTYEKNLSLLFEKAKNLKLQASFPHGIVCRYKEGKYMDSYMFLEVLPDSSKQVEVFREGNYHCFQKMREDHLEPLNVFPHKCFAGNETWVIVSCMSPDTYKYDKVILEYQIEEDRKFDE